MSKIRRKRFVMLNIDYKIYVEVLNKRLRRISDSNDLEEKFGLDT